MIDHKELINTIENKNKVKNKSYLESHKQTISLKAYAEAKAVITKWENYKPTELLSLNTLAKELNISKVNYKDESTRFGLTSFKALGGAYATAKLLTKLLKEKGLIDEQTKPSEVDFKKHSDFIKTITVCCATDGNHGRSVAWGASIFGCNAIIYLHATVSKEREDAIASYSAKIVRAEGNYDDAVALAQSDAAKNNYFVVSDTSYPGYTDVPKDVMQGYTVMVAEALDQMNEKPSHVFIQGGVGGLAAAVAGHLWETFQDDPQSNMPKIIIVEPDKADCLFQSAKEGKLTTVTGDLDTCMAGLACGEPSLLAWQILNDISDFFVVISDSAAETTMRLAADGKLASRNNKPLPFVAGESAVAGLAALILIANSESHKKLIGLTPDSKVLLFGTEGATAPSIYKSIVGKSAQEVLAG